MSMPSAARYAGSDIPQLIAVMLNSRWRIVDDGRQWMLQIHKGGDWRPRRYHVERNALLASIVELCGEVDQPTIWRIRREWPKLYRPPSRQHPPPA